MLAECSDLIQDYFELFVKKQRKINIQTQLYLVSFYYPLGYVSIVIRSHNQAYIKYAQRTPTHKIIVFLT